MPVGDGDDPLSLSQLPVPQHGPAARAVQPRAHPVPCQHLGSVLVLDLDDAGRLDPGFSIHLHGDAFVPPDGDLHHAALWGREPGVGMVAGTAPGASAAAPGPKSLPVPCQCQPGDPLSHTAPGSAHTPKAFRQHAESLAPTCAMRWCWRLMTRDTAIWMLPKTATTSSFLSSKDGAPKFCRGPVRPPNWAHLGTQLFSPCVPKAGTPQTPAQGFLGTMGKMSCPLPTPRRWHSRCPPWCLPRS